MREEWDVRTLGESCQIKPPKKEVRNRLAANDMVSFVPMNSLGIRDKGIKSKEDRPLQSVSGSYTYFADGDVLLAKITPCFENGKLGVARELTNGVGFGSSEFIVFRPKQGLDAEYLFYFLSQDSFRDAGAKVMSGAVGHKRVPKEFITDLTIPIPPLPEQKHIVAILDEAFAGIDTAIANTRKNLASARELLDEFVISALKDSSTEWTTLGELSESMEYGSSAKSLSDGLVPVLRMGNIKRGRFSWSDLKYSNNPIEIEKYKLEYNDVLFNRTNSPELVGKTAIYKGEKESIFAGYLIRINRNKALLDPDFLCYFLNSPFAMNHGRSVMSSSVNQANINATKLKAYPIPRFTLEEQKSLVEIFGQLSSETQRLESIYQQKLTALAELKQSLLQRAFSGQLTADRAASNPRLKDEEVA